jgi:hypothetical protein
LRAQHPATLLRYEFKNPSKRRTKFYSAIGRHSTRVIAIDLTTFFVLRPARCADAQMIGIALTKFSKGMSRTALVSVAGAARSGISEWDRAGVSSCR